MTTLKTLQLDGSVANDRSGLRLPRAAVPVLLVAIALASCGGSASKSADPAVADSTAAAVDPTAVTDASEPIADASVEGAWTVSTAEGGYRVSEVLQGQKTEAVGRTTAVTGSMTLVANQATEASFEFDLTKLESDSGKRDGQVQGRILQTAQFPTAGFTLTAPIDFGALPAEGAQVAVKATGDLTLHGVTKSVTVDLQARRKGSDIQVLGNLPITFADWGIENPSIKPFVEVGETGVIEWLVSMTKA